MKNVKLRVICENNEVKEFEKGIVGYYHHIGHPIDDCEEPEYVLSVFFNTHRGFEGILLEESYEEELKDCFDSIIACELPRDIIEYEITQRIRMNGVIVERDDYELCQCVKCKNISEWNECEAWKCEECSSYVCSDCIYEYNPDARTGGIANQDDILCPSCHESQLLKNLDKLDVLEIPLERKAVVVNIFEKSNDNKKACTVYEINNTLGIKEHDLEKYLLSKDYNVYNSEDLYYRKVIREDLTLDSVLISDVMIKLGFSVDMSDDKIKVFYIKDKIKARYLEIIQDVCGVKSGLNYSVSDYGEDEMMTSIYVYDSEENDKEYKIIYSFENDDYIVKK